MSRERVKRCRILLAGFLLALMGGVSYAWGVFVLPMVEQYGWTKTSATLPFTVFVVVFALLMVPAGRLQDRIGPRKATSRQRVTHLVDEFFVIDALRVAFIQAANLPLRNARRLLRQAFHKHIAPAQGWIHQALWLV